MYGKGEITFRTAVATGNLKSVEEQIISVGDINETNRQLVLPTALFLACIGHYRNQFQIVRLLVEHGANLEITDRNGQTCLKFLNRRVNDEVLEYLLTVGGRVNRRYLYGDTVLHNGPLNRKLKLLLRQGAIMRRNESDQSPIISHAHRGNRETVEWLAEHVISDRITTFTRHNYSSSINLKEKVDAYKFLGNSYPANRRKETIQDWTKAMNIYETAGANPGLHVERASSCSFCVHVKDEDPKNYAKVGDAWNAVKMKAREIVTGMELLERTKKCGGPIWMSTIIPCFQCPTASPGRVCSVTHQSVSQIRRCQLLDKVYLEKWLHLQTELKLLHKEIDVIQLCQRKISIEKMNETLTRISVLQQNNKRSNVYDKINMRHNQHLPFSSKRSNNNAFNLNSAADVFLGIEPTCFIQIPSHQNNGDPMSYHLQRQWLISQCYTHPRTAYRCMCRVCTVCGHMVLLSGGVDASPMSILHGITGVMCKSCSLGIHGIGVKMHQYLKILKTTEDNHDYRNLEVSKQKAAMKVCSYCGLVSEQHPQLQRLLQCSKEVFGNLCEFNSATEVATLLSNPSAIRWQKGILNLRLIGSNYPYKMLCFAAESTWNDDITAFEKYWRYNFHFLKIFTNFCLGNTDCYIDQAMDNFEVIISRMLAEKKGVCIDPTIIVDYLEITVDIIERYMASTMYQQYTKEMVSDSKQYLSTVALKLIMLVMSYYLPEIPVGKSHLKGRCLVNLVARKYSEERNHFESITSHTTNCSNSYNMKSNKQNGFSAPLVQRFISHVYRLVCLDPRSTTGQCLLHLTGSRQPSHLHIDKVKTNYKVMTIKLLLQLGADPNSVDINGETVARYLLRNNNLSNDNVFSMLISLIEGGAHSDSHKFSYNDTDQDERMQDFLQEYNIFPVRNTKLVRLAATVMRQNHHTSRHLNVKNYL